LSYRSEGSHLDEYNKYHIINDVHNCLVYKDVKLTECGVLFTDVHTKIAAKDAEFQQVYRLCNKLFL